MGEEKRDCENYKVFNEVGFCETKDILCLCNKYSFENIKKSIVPGPYSEEIIYHCDGIKPTRIEGE